ncbi:MULTISPECIES: hypothetical protein [unclassified Corallococcus]|uniref:hypothetical protein n=1 Tax=Corallococcus sp. NCSPR001 TaxID=2813576 RepID=UPI001F5CDEDA|nr:MULTISPECIES: hypothetical protein [unclassified Corallococcus]WAS88753.1 hypothetical protein O0N60_17605 [Corallococcus sp. NCRR]
MAFKRAKDERRGRVEHPIAPAAFDAAMSFVDHPGMDDAQGAFRHQQRRGPARAEALGASLDDSDGMGLMEVSREGEVPVLRVQILD